MAWKRWIFVDVDGTLVRWVYCDLWAQALVEFGLLRKVNVIRLDRAREAYRRREGEFSAFGHALVSSVRIGDPLKNFSVEQMKLVCEELANRTNEFHVFVQELIASGLECGYEVAFITGSPTLAVQPLAKRLGVNPELVRGTTLYDRNGCLTGGIDDSAYKNKQETVLHLVGREGDLKQSVAIGDTTADVSMLETVGYPIAFNPSVELLEKACEEKWPFVTERKIAFVQRGEPNGGWKSEKLSSILPADLAASLASRLTRRNAIAPYCVSA